MSGWQVAQLNIAQMLAPADSPLLEEFFANLDRVNALADAAPGFVWRLQSETGSAISTHLFGENVIVNMSGWSDIESLHDYVYRTAHTEFIAKRKQWFEHLPEAYSVLWWVPTGSAPTIEQAKGRLELLKTIGSSQEAFTFKKPFPPPGHPAEVAGAGLGHFDDGCPAT